MNRKVAFGLLLAFVVSLVIAIGVILKCEPVSRDFTESLVIELVGAGLITIMVSLLMLFVQWGVSESMEVNRRKNEQLEWIESQLEPSLKPVLNTKWGSLKLDARENFYLHGVISSPLRAFLDTHHNKLLKAAKYVDTPIVQQLIELKESTDSAMQYFEILDEELQQEVRSFNAERGAISANDRSFFLLTRAKLFFKIPDEQVEKWIERSNPQARDKLLDQLGAEWVNDRQQKVDDILNSLRGMVYKIGGKPLDDSEE